MTLSTNYIIANYAELQFPFFDTLGGLATTSTGGSVSVVNAFGATDIQFRDATGVPTLGVFGITGTNGSIARLENGNYAVVTQDTDSIRYMVIDSAGQTVVAQTDIGDFNSTNAEVIGLAGGGFAIVNQDFFAGNNEHDIDLRVYDSAGALVFSRTMSGSLDDDVRASVAQASNGNIMVAWHRNVGSDTQLWTAVYDTAGNVVQAAAALDSFGTINRNAHVIAYDTGFAIAYEDNGWDSEVDVTLAFTNASGVLQSWHQIEGGAGEAAPRISAMPNGLVAITFEENTFGDTDSIVWVYDPATFTQLASYNVANNSVFDDIADVHVVTSGFGIVVQHSNFATGQTEGGVMVLARLIDSDATGELVTVVNDGMLHQLRGNEGNDTLIGSAMANETLEGGDGDDRITGNNTDTGTGDLIYGGAGNDTVTIAWNEFPAVLDGGTGVDTLVMNGEAHDTTVNLNLGTFSNIHGTGNFTGFENFDGSGSDGAMLVLGTAQNNVMSGGIGNDSLDGQGNNDTLTGGGGLDTLIGAGGADLIDGGSGDDAINAGQGSDSVIAGTGNDSVQGQGANDTIHGGDGLDTIRGGLGLDLINGDADADMLYGDAGADTINGGLGDDTIYGGNQVDVLNGDDGNDHIYGGLSRDVMSGGTGSDTFYWNVNDFGTNLRAGADRITDFSQAQGDRIDLSVIDASTTAAGNNAFSWIGNAAFSSVGGQLRFVQELGNTYVEGDRNGDGLADFAIRLDGLITLTAADFVL